ncbi:RINT1-like protein MAG2L isoform X2 [Juglans microcarpa x Juglans regia]|nr:RINT1-like protein MAG2L isoform X2 [Juglans microcarpa x Juglans regia]
MFAAKFSNSSIATDSEPNQEKLLQAMKFMNDIEEVLISIVKFQPQWCNLLKCVDTRVDKILGVLRPQVLAEHRALLVSLGWPPKLLTSTIESAQISGLPNPLVLMQGNKRECYSHSFVALCALQHLQKRREERQLNILGRKEYSMQLWAIDELVSPIASRMEYHFLKWADQPEFMFALVYKITRDFIAGVDDVLQPLIDKARLVSCSAKEAWVSAMIQILSGFLAKRIFSRLAERYKEKHSKSEVMTSWLHLIDLIVSFDKRMQSLVNLETCLFLVGSESFEGLSRGISVLMIFVDKPDWLKLWAKIELKDACKKLKAELKDERAWKIDNKTGPALHINTDIDQYLLSTREEHKAPFIAEFTLKIAWQLIERCQTMPATFPRLQFIRSAVVKFLWYFFEVLLLRFKRTEFSPDNSDDDALVRLCGLINAARFVESKLQEWSDDVDILEMRIAENDSNLHNKEESIDSSCFFGEEIANLSELETNWLMEIISFILREFENLSWEYVQNKEHFEQQQEQATLAPATMDLVVSSDFVEALDILRSQLHVLKTNLNPKDFLDLWRSVAEGLDHFISCTTLTNEFQFSESGVSQFETDMQALFFIFQPFCARPQAFFPCIKETLKLLQMNKEGIKHLQVVLFTGKNGIKCLHSCGISHLPFDQVDTFLRNRKFET